MRGQARDPSQRQWIGRLVDAVVRRPDPDAARALWSTFYAVDPAEVGTSVADPEFSKTGAALPFGWRIVPSGGGIAGVHGGALEVYYYGRSTTKFASQL